MKFYLKTARLELVPQSLKFLESTHEYAGDEETNRYMLYLPSDTIEDTKKFLLDAEAEWNCDVEIDSPCFMEKASVSGRENQKSFECAVLCGGRHIGGVNIYIVDEGQKIAELGWCLNKKAQGYGYAFEAAEALVNWAKEVLGVKCFIAHCDSENIPSWKTMEKLGMRRVSCTGGRFNKSAPNEERKEFMYEMKI